MKYLLICIVIVTATACSKSAKSPDNDSVIGSWRLIRYTGGYAGVDSTIKPNERNTLYTYTEDNVLRVFKNNTLISESPYSITAEQMGGQTIQVLSSGTPDAPVRNWMVLKNDTLQLTTLNIICAIGLSLVKEK